MPHTVPETYRLGVLPRLLPILAVLRRPRERFVMVNLLAFKPNAGKPYEGRSGREAYMTYAATVEQAQGPMGSKLLWGGDLTRRSIGPSEPRFEMAGLLEYASPRAFLTFATSGRSNTKARAAGLAGQWLLACTTEARAEVPDGDASSLALLELIGEGDAAWRTSWRNAIEARGGRLLWSGRVDQHVIGTSSPAVRRVVLHRLPDEAQTRSALRVRRRPGAPCERGAAAPLVGVPGPVRRPAARAAVTPPCRARVPIRTTVAFLRQELAFQMFAWSFQAPSSGVHTFRYFPRSTTSSGP